MLKRQGKNAVVTGASKAMGAAIATELAAAGAAFLASDESRWLTGEVILASGGLRY